jgi:NADPH:quinone reductase-like Zn-dependent oxidoreductase
MKVMRFNGSVDAPGLVEGEAEVPVLGDGEVLIRVHAAGVTPTELGWYPATHTKDGGKRRGAIPGHEFSGVIERAGPGVDQRELGREVFGMNDWFENGATAEYCVAKLSDIAEKPRGMTHAEAATAPISALTAWQSLKDRAKVVEGERVLIHGGAGAVGVFAVQIARSAGAHVIATASGRHRDLLLRLGAHEVIDYREERFEQRVRDVDVVLDTVGGETLERSWGVLRRGGRLVTIAASSSGTGDARTEEAFLLVKADGRQLAVIGKMIEEGSLRSFVDGTVRLEEATEAYLGRTRRKNGRGKVLVCGGLNGSDL